MQRDLIFDIGMHNGGDTEFYLKKGFRVVGVEANNVLCEQVMCRLPDYVRDGRLTIINRAVAEEPGEVAFYVNDQFSTWGTLDPAWARRNESFGAPSTKQTVIATTMDKIIAEHGVPYYMKIDIEGYDMVALKGLETIAERPKYVSLESEKVFHSGLRDEFSLLKRLGYNEYKIVPQHVMNKHRLPVPAREGQQINHSFNSGDSGPFGEETPGAKWLSEEEAMEVYRGIFVRYGLLGDAPLIRNRYLRKVLKLMTGRVGWYDTHARLTTPNVG